MQLKTNQGFRKLLLSFLSIVMLAGLNQLHSQVNLTLRVNMSNETVDPLGVFIESSLAWGSPQAMTSIGGGVYSKTIVVPNNATFQYKFKNGTVFEGNAGSACGLGANRQYTVGTVAEILPTVCFGGSCADCATSVSITFRVNMSNVTVSGTGVFFESSLAWGNPLAMTAVGGGVYSVTVVMATNATIQYKFKNGTNFESNAQAGCNAGANRAFTSGTASATLPIVCFNGFCIDCAAVQVSTTFRVNMQGQTIDPSGVFFESSLGWGSPVPMTLLSGTTYTVTILSNTNTLIQYKFKNGTNFEGNANSGCNAGANRSYTIGLTDASVATVCFGGSCTNCATTAVVTFRVNMSNVTVTGAGVNLETSLAWGAPIAMTNIGAGVYSVNVTVPVNTTIQYKFKNGTSLESNAQAGCNAGANRVYTVGTTDVILPTVCYNGSCVDCLSASNVNITFRVNMTNETISGGVNFASSLNGFVDLPMTSIGGNVYSVTVNAPVNTNIQYKFKNGAIFEGNAQAGCNSGANRLYNSGASDATLPTVCYGGSCSNCIVNTAITFSVNMSTVTVDPSGVFLETSLGWGAPIAMTTIGGGVYTTTLSINSNTTFQYKFKNGSNFEGNAEVGCNAGANRVYTTGTSDATLPTVCFGGSCSNCPSTIQATFRVNMAFETIDPSGVFFASSLNGFTPVSMTLLSGTIYTVTVTAPVNAPLYYKFKNGPNFEANAQAGCSFGANRLYTTTGVNSIAPTVCYNGLCTNCPTNVDVTFQVNMAAETILGPVYLIHSLNGFAHTPMVNVYDDIYSVTVSAPLNTAIQYKFKNFTLVEANAQAGCSSGANRVINSGTSNQTIPVVCFGGSCSNCVGTVDLTFNVNMYFETIDPLGVNLSTSADGFASLIPMTNLGNDVYTATITVPSNTGISYKFRNGTNFEGHAQSGCQNGINRLYTTQFVNASIPTVCFGGSCSDCPTTWTSVVTGPWNTGSTWDQGTPPPTVGVDVIIASGHIVTLNTNATIRNLEINAGAELVASDGTPRVITLLNGGLINNQGTYTSNSGSSIIFNPNTTVAGDVIVLNATINGSMTILNSFTVNGSFTILNGGYLNGVISPNYGPNSVLIYSIGDTYGRGLEWNSLTGAGYPNNVLITNNTTLQPGANGGQAIARAIAHNLTIEAGSALYMDWAGLEMNRVITIGGNLNLNGNLSLSSLIGGDLVVKGSISMGNSSSFNSNNRTLTLNGGTTQTISGTALTVDLSYLVVNNSSQIVCELPINISNDITIGSSCSFDAISNMNLANGGTLFGILKIFPSRILAVTGGTLTSNGYLNMLSDAVLLHGVGTPGGGGAVVGNVKINRSGAGTGNWAYNYIASPVANALASLMGDQSYYYDPYQGTNDTADDEFDPGWIPSVGTMTIGQGYAANNYSNIQFSGPVNNANINYSVVSAPLPNSKFNLIGNPYPSPISASAFLATNGPSGSNRLTGAMYFWDDDLSVGQTYTVSDYAVWNGAGSISSSGLTPNGTIAIGQGFLIEANSNGNILFQNSMRTAAPAIFFEENTIKRVKLGIHVNNNNYNETLIAFIEDATEENDSKYDATKIAGNPTLAFYSFLNQEKLAIQGLPDITESRTVNLGIQSSFATEHTIMLQSLENFDNSVAIYLEDLELETITNIRIQPNYHFTPLSMDLDERFVLRFTAPIATSNTNSDCNNTPAQIAIENPSEINLSYQLIDANSQLIIQNGTSSLSHFEMNNVPVGAYLLRMTMPDNYSFTKEIFIQAPEQVQLFVSSDYENLTTNETVTFHAISNGNINWTLGDGTYIGNGQVVNYLFNQPGIYTIVAKSTLGDCDSETSFNLRILENNITGINTIANENFLILPNPANSSTQVIFSGKQTKDNVLIRLFDGAGRVVMEQNTVIQANSKIEIHIDQFAKGIYTVMITGESINKSSRLIVN